MAVVVRHHGRADPATVEGLSVLGVATVHEAYGRRGLLAPRLRPIFPGTRVGGTAVTVSVPPGDNWMIHVAVEQCRAGDVVVVSPTSSSDAGYIGELLATALQYRGVVGLVIDAGCRDVAELTTMHFPVWSACISATGCIKRTLGDVNRPIVCAGQAVVPGDVVVADDDGVVVVSRGEAAGVLAAARARAEREVIVRTRYESGELGLDIHNMRAELAALGLAYVDAEDEH